MSLILGHRRRFTLLSRYFYAAKRVGGNAPDALGATRVLNTPQERTADTRASGAQTNKGGPKVAPLMNAQLPALARY